MSFTKQQRKGLNDLSLMIFGTSSRWEKLLKNIKIPSQLKTDTASYVRDNHGVLLREDTAFNRGLIKRMSEDNKRVVYRQPTIEELVQIMIMEWDRIIINSMKLNELMLTYACRLLTGELRNEFYLNFKGDEKEAVLNLINKVNSPNAKEVLNKVVSDGLTKSVGFPAEELNRKDKKSSYDPVVIVADGNVGYGASPNISFHVESDEQCSKAL